MSTIVGIPGLITTPASGGGSGSATVNGVTKTADESVTSSTALQDDDELALAVSIGRYTFELVLGVDCASASVNIKCGFSAPTTGLIRWGAFGMRDASGGFSGAASTLTTGLVVTVQNSVENVIVLKGMLDFTAAGTFTFQWAQGTSSGTALTVRRNSYMQLITV